MGVEHAIDLTATQRRTVLALLKRHLPGTAAWVYGSRAKWTSTPQSDLDLVVFAKPEQQRQVGDLREAFDESTLPFRVDLFVWDEVSDSVRRRIESERVALVDRLVCDGHKDWRNSHWGELVTLEYGRALRDYHKAEGLFRVFGTNGPIGWHNKALSCGASVVVGRKGAYRGIHYSPDPCFVIDTAFYLQPKVDIDLRWAYYSLLIHNINELDSGSAIPSTSRGEFYGLPVSVPPLSEQQAIAHVLGTLDHKIDLNRSMNATLEAMARALFKSWFVDFDPVRAKMEGRHTGLPQDIADLFPDRLVDSKLGEMPEGWEVRPLSECIEVERGLSYKGSGLSSDGMPMHNLNSVYEGGGYKDAGIKHYDGEYTPRHVVQPADVIVANTEQGHDRLLIGYAAVVPARCGPIGLFSHHLYRVRPKKGSVSLGPDFICQLFNTQAMHDTISGYATGTTVNMLPVDALKLPAIVVPPKHIMVGFTVFAEAIGDRSAALVEESRTLIALRDTLLPNLISGKLRVKGTTDLETAPTP